VVPSENIGREVASGNMTKVERTVGIGPGYGDENTLRHWANPYRTVELGYRNSAETESP
jgi:hypothetical protein